MSLPASAQAIDCATTGEDDDQVRQSFTGDIPTTGTFRALAIFVRYEDDFSESTCSQGIQQWPADPNTPTLPLLASYLLAEQATPPFPDSSLTQYFYEQSNQNFILYGDAIAYTTALAASSYQNASGNLNRCMLTTEILNYLTSNQLIDPNDYDDNNDGYVDHVFIILRSRNIPILGTASGISDLGCTLQYGSVTVHHRRSGSVNFYQPVDVTRDNVALLAHEIGHDIWNDNGAFINHLNPIIGNMVPYVPPPDQDPSNHSFADRMVGYSLMIGSGPQTRNVWGLHPTAAERSYLSIDAIPSDRWADCHTAIHGNTYLLEDFYATGSCFSLELSNNPRVDELFVQHVAGSSFFNEVRTNPSTIDSPCPGCHVVEGGTPETGLLIELSSRLAAPDHLGRYHAERDIIPADNEIDKIPACWLAIGIGPSIEEFYIDDFWRPENRRQLSPWTRPNVYGHTFGSDVPAAYYTGGWHVLDNLRYGPTIGSSIEFDYYSSPFALDTFFVREDSWMDIASDAIEFLGHVRVLEGATLHIDSIYVAFHEGLSIDDGASLAINQDHPNAPPATLAFGIRQGLIIAGELLGQNVIFEGVDPTEPWQGIHLAGGQMALVDAKVTLADVGIDVQSHPNTCVRCTVTDNSIGLRTDYSLSPSLTKFPRSEIELHESDVSNNTSIGIEARNVDLLLMSSTVTRNERHGIALWNATVHALYANVVIENGDLINSLYDGIVTISHGDVHLSHLLGHSYNQIRDNAFDQVMMREGSYGFIGSNIQNGHNSITSDQLASGAHLVHYHHDAPELEARYTYWGDPDGPASGSIEGRVEFDPWLEEDPTSGFRPYADASQPLSLDQPHTDHILGAKGAPDLGWLRDAIRSARSAAENTEASDAAQRVRNLYGIQRIDQDDLLGEYTLTRALLRQLRQNLHDAPSSSARRHAAEAALLAEVHEALRRNSYEEAGALVQYAGPFEQPSVARDLELARAMLDEHAGEVEFARERLNSVITALSSEDPRLAGDLELVAEAMEAKLNGPRDAGRGVDGRNGPLAVDQAFPSLELSAVFPNPAREHAELILTLPEEADVQVNVYDLLGRRVITLENARMSRGTHRLTVPAHQLPSGSFVVRANVAGGSRPHLLTQRLTVIN